VEFLKSIVLNSLICGNSLGLSAKWLTMSESQWCNYWKHEYFCQTTSFLYAWDH